MDIGAAYDLIVNKIQLWVREFVKLLPNMALAVLVLILGIFISKYIARYSCRLFKRITKHSSLNNLFYSFMYVLGIGMSLFAALSILNLDKAVTSILAGAGIAGLALAFAFQDLAANFISGVILIIERPIKPGDIVGVKEYEGYVVAIRLRDTTIRTYQSQLVIIPNKDILQNALVNFTKLGKRRIDLEIGVSYGEDLERVKEVAVAAANQVSVRTADPVTLYYKFFADSSINFVIRVWIKDSDVFMEGRSQIIMLIKKAFDENGIQIPYPIRTLDFGIKGGEKLSDMAINLNGGRES